MNDSSVNTRTSTSHFVGAGVVILRKSENEIEVLLIRRGKPPREGEWSIPGGRQELGETIRETAIREIMEETSLVISDIELVDVVDTFSTVSDGNVVIKWTLVDFCAWWRNDPAQAGSDAAEVKWVPVSNLNSYNLWNETIRIIEQVVAKPPRPNTIS